MENTEGLTIKVCRNNVDVTLTSLLKVLHNKGLKVYAIIDQQKELKSVDLSIRPMQLVIFGNPYRGGQILKECGVAGIDLPLKVLIWEECDGAVKLAYNSAQYLASRYRINEELQKLLNLDALIDAVLES